MALGLRRLGCRINIDAAPAAGVEVVVIVGGGGVFHLGLELCAEVLVLQLVGHGMETVCEVPRRHTGVQGRHVAGVGVLVADDGNALVAGLVHEGEGLLLLAPVGLAEHLVVGDVHEDARLTADVDGLFHGLDDLVALVAHMAGVDAVEGGDDLGQFNDLLFLGVAAGRIDEAGGEAGCAVFHRLAQDALHPVKLRICCGAVGHAHHGDA